MPNLDQRAHGWYPAAAPSGPTRWGPDLPHASWGPDTRLAPPQAAAAEVLPAAKPARPTPDVIWLDKSTRVAVTVRHAGATEEELLAALEAAVERLRVQVEAGKLKAA